MTTHKVALAFEDGVTRFINCREDQTVADASYRQRINIPLDCRDGACGTCKAFCESGRFDGGTYIDDALSADEAAEGFVLPCSMKPRSDLVLQIASTSEVAKTQAATYTGKLVELQRLSATTVRFGVEIPDREQLAFLPGQYVNIAVPGTDMTRSYSFSNAPHETQLTFLVKLTPGGAMSGYLADRAAVGDEITFTGPHGSFFLREIDRPVLLLAGGTGLAPILAMLRKMRAEGSHRKAHLVYGVSTDADLVELDTLSEVAAGLTGFSWDYCVSDPASTAANKGFVMSLMRPEHMYDGDVAIYLCGPPPMVEAVRNHVAEAGIEPTGFYYEKFALAPPAARSTARTGCRQPCSERRAAALARRPRGGGAAAFPADKIDHGGTGRARRAGRRGPPHRRPDDGIRAPATAPGPTRRGSGLAAVRGPHARRPDAPPAVPVETRAPRDRRVAEDGYQIGEEHPEVHESDAIFEARQALELGALELTLGRLSSRQLAGYRLLAESTLPYVEGDQFVDAAQYTETNAAFHDYLFTLTGNDHLLQAYQALGVKGRMSEVLRNARWCHPLCAQDHMDIVSAFESGDRDAARALIIAHADRSKQTMRRAMADAGRAAAEVHHPGPVRRQGRRGHRGGAGHR